MKISIVITAYNKEATLQRAVESAVGQTWGNIEVILVEDKSTDNTRDIAFGLAEKYPSVTLLLCGRNIGAGLSRRRGISASRGDYVLLLDGDDYLKADYVEALARRARKENADIVTGGISIHKPDGNITEVLYGNKVVTGDDKVVCYFGQTTMFLNNRLIRRSLYDKVPYSDRRYIEDVPTCVKLLWYANKNCFVENAGYHYSYNKESLTHTADRFKTHLFKTLCIADLTKFFAKNDAKYLRAFDFEGAYKIGLKKLLDCNPTEEMVAPYAKEWEELRQFAESKDYCFT